MCECTEQRAGGPQNYQYAAKLVCGEVKAEGPVAPGRYWTAINIHNPSRCDSVRFLWKVAVGTPFGSKEKRMVTGFREVILGPDEAIEIDCPDAFRLLKEHKFSSPFVKGWVVLEAEGALDVVAVYSSAFEKGPVSTFHTERVPGRRMLDCRDCAIQLTTGIAPWETIGFTATNDQHPAWTTIPGATWLRAPNNRNPAEYRLCFDLCPLFEANPIALSCASDDEGFLSVNGQAINTAPFGFGSAMSLVIPPNVWQPGRNCITVRVNNTGSGPIGFAMVGQAFFRNGCCS